MKDFLVFTHAQISDRKNVSQMEIEGNETERNGEAWSDKKTRGKMRKIQLYSLDVNTIKFCIISQSFERNKFAMPQRHLHFNIINTLYSTEILSLVVKDINIKNDSSKKR